MSLTRSARQSLLGTDTSRQNKLWLALCWVNDHDWYIKTKWEGEPMRSRLMFQFEPSGPFVRAKSFDEDIVPTFKFSDGSH